MYARVATFESDPGTIDDAIRMVREEVAGDTPEGLPATEVVVLHDPRPSSCSSSSSSSTGTATGRATKRSMRCLPETLRDSAAR